MVLQVNIVGGGRNYMSFEISIPKEPGTYWLSPILVLLSKMYKSTDFHSFMKWLIS